MTDVISETDILEMLDFDTVLNCMAGSCNRVADYRIRIGCGCVTFWCDQCLTKWRKLTEMTLKETSGIIVICDTCKTEFVVFQFSQLATSITPLHQ